MTSFLVLCLLCIHLLVVPYSTKYNYVNVSVFNGILIISAPLHFSKDNKFHKTFSWWRQIIDFILFTMTFKISFVFHSTSSAKRHAWILSLVSGQGRWKKAWVELELRWEDKDANSWNNLMQVLLCEQVMCLLVQVREFRGRNEKVYFSYSLWNTLNRKFREFPISYATVRIEG